jgi:hypothetical protein
MRGLIWRRSGSGGCRRGQAVWPADTLSSAGRTGFPQGYMASSKCDAVAFERADSAVGRRPVGLSSANLNNNRAVHWSLWYSGHRAVEPRCRARDFALGELPTRSRACLKKPTTGRQ